MNSSVLDTMRDQIRLTPMPAPRRQGFGWLAIRPRLLVGGSAVMAATVAAAVLAIGATSPPAYALIHNPDGTYTVRLYDLAGVPALNHRLADLGIQMTVVPVTADCHAQPPDRDVRSSVFLATASQNGIVMLGSPGRHQFPGWGFAVKPVPDGFTGVLAAKPLPDGKIGMLIGVTKLPVPACFSNALLERPHRP